MRISRVWFKLVPVPPGRFSTSSMHNAIVDELHALNSKSRHLLT